MVITSWLAALTNKLFGKQKTNRTRNRNTQRATQATQTAETLEMRTLMTVNAVADLYNTGIDEDNVFNVSAANGVLNNDPAGTGTSVAVQDSDTTNGSVSLGSDGSFSYDPGTSLQGLNFGETSTETFDYHVEDDDAPGTIGTSATVTLVVAGVNDQTSATNTNQNLGYTEDSGAQSVGATIVVSDVDAGEQIILTLTLSDSGAGTLAAPGANFSAGVLSMTDTVANVNTALASLTFTPTADYNSDFQIDVNIKDGLEDSKTPVNGTIFMTGSPVNDVPTFTVGGDQTIDEDDGDQTVTGFISVFSPGPANESGQAVDFIVSNNNNPLFSVQPSIAPDGTLTYTPADDANGVATVTVQIHDDAGGTDTSTSQTFTITVNAVNDVPTFTVGGNQTVDEDDGAQTVSGFISVFSPGPGDESGQAVDFIVSNNNNPLFGVQPSIAPDGTLTYTPADDANGVATVTVQIHDDAGGTDTSTSQTFTITVNAINDAPAAYDTFPSVNEDTVLNSSVAVDDVENDSLTYTLLDDVDHGTLFLDTDGTYTYTPDLNFHGTDTFTFKVNDGEFDSNIATVTITVISVNDVPVAGNNSATTNEDESISIDVLSNDSDADNDALYLFAGLPQHGTAAVNNQGTPADPTDDTITYTPDDDYNGPDSFTYIISDNHGGITSATVNITVTSVNDAPVADDDNYSTNEDTPLVIGVAGVLGNDSDSHNGAPGENNTPLAATVVDEPEHGTVLLNSDGSFTYTPDDDYHGPDSFTYNVTDSLLDTSETATVYINVESVNDVPTFTVGGNQTINEDAGAQSVSNFITVYSPGPADESGQVIDYIVSNDNPTLFSVAPAIAADGTLTYTPDTNQNGTATVTVRIHDNGGGATDTSAPQTFTITVNSVNDAPDVADDSYTVDEDTTLNVDILEGVLANDSDSHGGTLNENNTPFDIAVVDDPLHGDLTLNDDGSFTYTPNDDYNGTDSFTYTVTDSLSGVSSVATVSLTITSVNDVPVVNNDSYSTNEDTPLTITDAVGVLANDSDFHGGAENENNTPLIADVVVGPLHGDLTLNDDGSFTYIPDDDYNGTDSFTYHVTDFLTGVSNTATVNLTINTVNDAPIVADDFYTLTEDDTLTTLAAGGSGILAGVLANDSDSHGGTNNENNTPLIVSVVDLPSHGELTLNEDGSFTYTPDADYNGTDSFTYEVTDDLLAVSTVATVHLTITSVNDAPDVDNDYYETNEDATLTILAVDGVLANDSDFHDGAPSEDNLPLIASVVDDVQHGSLTLNDDGSFTYTPDDDYYGDDSFTYHVTDFLTGISSTATVNLTIHSVNDAPTVTLGANIDVLEDDDTTITNLISNGGFEDGLDDWITLGIDVEDAMTGNHFYSQTGTLTPFSSLMPGPGPGPGELEMDFTVQAPSHDDYAAMSDQIGPGASVLFQDFVIPTGVTSATLIFNLYINNHAGEYFDPDTLDPFSDPNQQARVDIMSSTADAFSTESEDVLLNIFRTSCNEAAEFGYTTITADLSCLLATHTGETLRLRFATTNTEFFFEMGVDNVQLLATTTATRTVAGFASGISAGGGETQNLTFEVTNDNNDMFLEQPALDPVTGNLTYTLAPNCGGSALVTVYLMDDGDTDYGGVNTTGPLTFTITAGTVNDAPTFTKGLYEDVKEDSGEHIVAGWATQINAGVPNSSDEGGQELTFTVTNDNNDLFAIQPSIDPLTGDLTYTLADDAFGYANVYVTLSDDGGTDDGGSDTSATQMFTIIARNVNDAPSFDLPALPDQTILEDAGPQTVLGFASNMSAGPANEADQELCFKIRTSDDCMFTTLPYIDPLTGDLTYEIAPNANGDVTITVTLKDDGGRDDCGENRSAPQYFTIHVTPVQDPPVASDDYVSATEDTHRAIYVLDNDTDPDGDPLAIFVNSPLHGSASVNDNGTPGDFTDDFIDYTPALNYNGPDTFTYKIDDPNGGTSTATVHINVTSVNDAPIGGNDAYTANEDTLLSIPASGVLSNDSDFHGGAPQEDNNPIVAILVNGTSHGLLELNPDGSFTYLPASNYFGLDSFTYVAVDTVGDSSNTVTVTLNVRAVNDPPVALPGSFNIQEEESIMNSVSATDIDSANLTYILVDNAGHGDLTLSPSGIFHYTPHANYNGTDSFSFKANDGSADSNLATINITIGSVNDVPLTAADSYSTNEDTQLVIAAAGVLANDSDLHGGAPGENNIALTAALVNGPSHGTLALNPNGSFTYTPDTNFNGPDSFTYRAVDSLNAAGNTVTVSLTINAVNDEPVAVASSHTIAEESTLNSSVSSTDVDGPSVTYILVSGVAHGTLDFHADGTYTYTPALNYNGTDSFKFKANDGSLDSTTANVDLIITAVNDAPVAYDDVADTPEDTPTSGTLGGTDVDNVSLTFIVVSPPSHGSVTVNPNTGAATYTPAADYFGTDSFSYKVNDGTLDSNTATVLVTITAVNDAPVATNGSVTLAEDGAGAGTAAASDVDNGSLTYSVVTPPAHGIVVLNPNSGAYTYTPNSDYNGPDSFEFKANDGLLDSNTATVSVTITAVNDAPTVTDGSLTTPEDTAGSGTLSGADIDSGSLTFSVVSPPAHGTVLITNAAAGAYTYTPDANYNGSDSFTFRANDGALNSTTTATVNLTITAVNDPPVANAGNLTVVEDTPKNGSLTGSDIENSPLTYSVASQPNHGTVVITDTATGAYTYTPALNYNGTDSFTFKVNDGSVDSTAATVNVTVTAVNDAPLATDGELSTPEDTPADRTMNGSDVDGDNSIVSIVTPPVHGTVVITNTTSGAYTYTPTANYNGPDSFTFKLTNGGLDSNIATITINVTAVNDTPTTTGSALSVTEDTPKTGTLTASDIDGNNLTYSIVGVPAHGTVVITNTATGAFTYTPAANYNGPDSFTFKVNDGTVDSTTSTVTITVSSVEDSLVLTLPSNAASFVTHHGQVIIDPAASAVDADTPAINFNGGSLKIQVTGNFTTNDKLDIINQSAGAGNIQLRGRTVLFGGTEIGRVNGKSTRTMEITFTKDAATVQAVNALLKLITFRTNNGTPSTLQRTVTFTLKNATNSVNATATQHVDILTNLPARSVQLSNGIVNYTNGAVPVVIDSTATVSGPASLDLDGGRLSVTITSGVSSLNRLGIKNVGGITLVGSDVLFNGDKIGRATIGNNTLSVSFSGLSATPAAAQALLRAITFATTSANTSLLNRVVSYRLTDVTGISSAPVTKTIHIS